METNEQLVKWVNGEFIHNKERDECCPDFSCCNSSVNTPKETRVKFLNANDEDRQGMLFGFLGTAIADYAKTSKSEKVVALLGNPPQEPHEPGRQTDGAM